MIQKKGCMPCKNFAPTIKKYAEDKKIGFKSVQMEDMPENIRPPFYPYFYLRKNNQIIDKWGGVNERKMEAVIKRNLKKTNL